MLTSLSIKKFRTFGDVTIPLGPISVFIGPNNSGKTNAIRALQLLALAVRTADWPTVPGLTGPDLLGATVSVEGAFGQTKLRLAITGPTPFEREGTASLVLSGDLGWGPTFSAANPRAKGIDGHDFNSRNAPEFLSQALKQVPQALVFFKQLRLTSLSVPLLREPSSVMKDPELGERGEHFAAVLDWVASKPAIDRAIRAELKKTLGLDGFTTQATAAGQKIAATIEGDTSFPATVVSDGVLLYMGLTTAARLVGPGSMLIIEEPENGVHPKRLRALLEQIRELSKRGTQILLTTHSPVLLDEFSREPECITVFDRDGSGTRVSTISGKNAEALTNGDFGAGELWFTGAIGGVP